MPDLPLPDLHSLPRYSVVSFFSGAGGLDLGLRGDFVALGQAYPRTRLDLVFAVERHPPAAATYRAGVGRELVQGDVWDALALLPASADLLVGGFPCQDVSVNGLGRGTAEGTRSGQYRALLAAAEQLRPRAVLIENVKALAQGKHAASFTAITAELAALGYAVTARVYNAADYGVPQVRERLLIVGLLNGADAGFVPPDPTHARAGTDGHLRPWVSAEAAIGDLMDRAADPDWSHVWSRAAVSPGQGDRHLRADHPGFTVRAEAHGNTHWHYRLKRRVSNREAARLQSFPDDFLFQGGLRETERMIGNAVPPVLGWHMAGALTAALDRS